MNMTNSCMSLHSDTGSLDARVLRLRSEPGSMREVEQRDCIRTWCNVSLLSQMRRHELLVLLGITSMIPVLGCAVSHPNGVEEGARYVFRWQKGRHEPWIVREITGHRGSLKVVEWLRQHDAAVRRSGSAIRNLAIRPRWVLYELSGETVREMWLVWRLPVDSAAPKAEWEFSVNIPMEDLEALQEIFRTYGRSTRWVLD